MDIAQKVASRLNCIKRKVAAVIVKNGRIISTGYNGTPRHTRNCFEIGCPRCNTIGPSGKDLSECYCSHGERKRDRPGGLPRDRDQRLDALHDVFTLKCYVLK